MSAKPCTILVVDDEPYVLTTLSLLLAREFEVLTAESAEAAMQVFARRGADLILTDQRMPGGMNGVELLEWVRQHSPRTIRLLMTGFAELEDAVEAINRGQVYRYLFKPWRGDELLQILRDAARTFLLERHNEQLVDELSQAKRDLEQRVHERTRELEEALHLLQHQNGVLERLTLTDPLTGLPNRRALDKLAEAEIRRHARYPSSLTMGLIDVDHFKDINSRYLFPGGDAALIELGKTLLASVRTVDHVGRLGGEEFLLIAPETNAEGAAALGERIRSAVEANVTTYKGQRIRVTVSVGLTVADPGSLVDYDQMKHAAAAALAEAKNAGRNRCVVTAASGPPWTAPAPVVSVTH